MSVHTAHTTAADLSSVDLTDLGLWAGGTPHDMFARMRAEWLTGKKVILEG